MIIVLCLLIFNFAYVRRHARALSAQVRARALELASVYHALSNTRPGTRVHSLSIARASIKLPVSCTVYYRRASRIKVAGSVVVIIL